MRDSVKRRRLRNTAVAIGALAATVVPLSLGSPVHAQDESDEPGCTRGDARVIEVQPIKLQNGTQLGRVALWYSPSSRCAWGAATNDTGQSDAEAGQLEVWVVRKDGRQSHGGTAIGQRVIGTAAIHDADTQSYVHARLDTAYDGEALGKTHWF
jgi:hypothetical protein